MEKVLLDLGANVNLLPYLVYIQLGLGELKPTTITWSLEYRSVKIPKGIVQDVLVQVDKFYYLVDYVVLNTEPVVVEPIMCPSYLGGHSWLPQMQSLMSLKVIYFQSIFLIDLLYKKTDLYAGIWNNFTQSAV